MPSLSGVALWIIGGLALLLVSAVGIEEVRIGNWQSDYAAQGVTLTNTQSDLTTAKASIATLQAGLDRQNAAFRALADKAAADKKAADARLKAALAAARPADDIVGFGPDFLNGWLNKEYGGVE